MPSVKLRTTNEGDATMKNLTQLVLVDELRSGDEWISLGWYDGTAQAIRAAHRKAIGLGVKGDLAQRYIGDGIVSLYTADPDTHLWIINPNGERVCVESSVATKSASDHTEKGLLFELFLAAHKTCPDCDAEMARYGGDESAVDLYCTKLCGVQLQAKWNGSSLRHTHPQDRRKFAEKRRAIGASKFYFSIGTPNGFKTYSLSDSHTIKPANRTRKNGRVQKRVRLVFAK